MDRHETIARDWGRAAKDGLAADSEEAQAIAARHCDWPSTTSTVTRSYVIGVSAMYVTDPRYGRNYD
ncbi:hypothetical protein M877_21935 [Streptomyces niveus NCIMB 11891]|nr:hypothetical protein M877_21935 [Streptomyces niveus NCIMB 11891]